jgi:WD40 repeat protein
LRTTDSEGIKPRDDCAKYSRGGFSFSRGPFATGGIPFPQSAPDIPDHEMIRCIGRGSYGEVWLGRNAVGTLRAVKVVYRSSFQDARPYEREFAGVQQYEPISRSNEGLVDVLQIGRNEEKGHFYYIMELADDLIADCGVKSAEVDRDGLTAATYVPKTLAHEIQARGRLPVQDCITLGLTLSLALGELHRHGLIHRDVKPSNIIFVGGVAKLADIGLVTGLDATLSYSGTEGFIPPEGATSPQADIYALGKLLYEVSTGKDRQDFPEPFTQLGLDAESKAIMELNAVLLRACANDPKERYQSAAEMNADLAFLNSGKSVKQKHALEKKLKFVTRVAVAAVAIVILGVIPYFLVIKEARHAHHETTRAGQAELLAKKSEAEAKEKLWESYLAQAQAGRFSNRAGRRFAGLELLKKAAQIRPSLELRNEAIAFFALPDLGLAKEWPIPGGQKLRTFDTEFKNYAVTDEEGNIRVRQLADSVELARLQGFGYGVLRMRFSPSGKLLAATYQTTNEPPLKIWDIKRNKIVCVPDITLEPGMAFSSDESRIAVINLDRDILIYNLKEGTLLRRIGFVPMASDVAFNPDGRMIAISTKEDGNIDIWDIEAGHRVRFVSNDAAVGSLAWSASGKLLAAGCITGYIRIWDTETGQQRLIVGHHEGHVLSIQFSHSGDLLASAGTDDRLILWSLCTGKQICSTDVSDYFCPFSSDDRALLSAVSHEKLGWMQVASGRECRLLRLEGNLAETGGCAFSPTGEFLAAADPQGLHFWKVATGEYLRFKPTEEEILSFGFNPSRQTLVIGGSKTVKEWTFQTITNGSSVRMSVGKGVDLGASGNRQFDDIGRSDTVLTMPENYLTAFDLKTGQHKAPIHPGIRSHFAALSPCEDLCALGSELTNVVSLCDVNTGKLLRTLPGCRSTSTLSFSPDNHWLALGGADEYRFFDTKTWRLVSSIPRKATGALGGKIAFSPDSRVAAISYTAQVIRLVDPASGMEFATLEPSESRNILSIAFSPDGTLLAVTTWGNLIQIWDLRLIRSELASMNLDWDLPPYPPINTDGRSLRQASIARPEGAR